MEKIVTKCEIYKDIMTLAIEIDSIKRDIARVDKMVRTLASKIWNTREKVGGKE